jgi:hypothetical protein
MAELKSYMYAEPQRDAEEHDYVFNIYKIEISLQYSTVCVFPSAFLATFHRLAGLDINFCKNKPSGAKIIVYRLMDYTEQENMLLSSARQSQRSHFMSCYNIHTTSSFQKIG